MASTNQPFPGPGADGISAPGAGSPGVPLSVEQQSLLTGTESLIQSHTQDTTSAVNQTLDEAYGEINSAWADMGVSLSTVLGTLDNQIAQQEYDSGKPLDKVITQHLVDIIGHENQLSISGVHVGGTTDEIASLVATATPDTLVSQLAGFNPLAGNTASECPYDVWVEPNADGTCQEGYTLVFMSSLGRYVCCPGSAATVPPASPPPPPPPPESPPPPPEPPPPPVSFPLPPPPTGPGGCIDEGPLRMPDCGPGVVPIIGPNPLTGVCEASCPVPPPPEPVPPVPPVPPPGCECPEPPTCPLPSPPAPEPPPVPPAPAPPPPEPPGEEVCRLPKPVHACAPDSRPEGLLTPIWCGPDVCGAIAEKLAAIEYDPAGRANVPPEVEGEERSIFGSLWAGITYPSRSIYTALGWIGSGFDEEVATQAKKEVGTALALEGIGAEALRTIIAGPFKDRLDHLPAVMRLGSQVAAAQMAEQRTGFPATYLVQNSLYLYQYANPQYIPSQSELDAEFLRGKITDNEWECLTRANGNQPQCFRKVRDSKELKPNSSEVMSLYLRGELDEKQTVQRMKELGVVDPAYTVEFRKLAQFIPPYTDITSFMVRDTFDEAVVKKYQYDKGFEQKFAGKAFDWAKAQGIDPEVFRMIWRAHWKIPSNTALYDMINRLRPDRPEVIQWDSRFVDPATGEVLPEAPPRPPVVTIDDVRNALEVNDVAPTWIDNLLAINTHPINRTDAINAYQANAFDEKQLYEAFRDNNYSPDDAQRSVDIQKTIRGRRFANLTGVWTFRKIVQSYQQGIIDTDKADALLKELMPDAVLRQDILSKANDEMNAKVKVTKIKKARRAFFTGEWTQDETRKYLDDIGVEPQRIHQLIDTWDAERTGRFREATVEMLRKWFVINVITQDDMYGRLIRLGFSDIDTRRIIAQAVDDSVQRQRKDLKYVRSEYQAAYKNLSDAAKATNDMLEDRREVLQAYANKVQAELVRIEKTLASRAP